MSESKLPKKQVLDYSFARANGVLITTLDSEAVIIHRASTSFEAILEARRVQAKPAVLKEVSNGEFETLAAQVYASSDLSISAEDAIGKSSDLNALADGIPKISDLLDTSDDAPVIRLINGVLQEAINNRASDIHIEPFEARLSIRFRIDGSLQEMLSLPSRLSPVLVSRVKVMAQLDIAKKRVPQDGRFSLNLGQRAIDIRVSTLPSRHGERLVMRILEQGSSRLELSDLGMTHKSLKPFEAALKRPNGIILVTGPTGSGKTTTLYAGLSCLNNGSRNILTVEDPIEYALDGIGQTQVNNQIGMTFAAGLRAILRQDPDVVMIGEIRDPETAEIAVQASLTGHLVLSTVHTNSAVAAIARLRDMGVESFLLSSTITALVAQRLVRRLCEKCKCTYEPSLNEKEELGISKLKKAFYKAKGCSHCNNTGYVGRIGIYEIVTLDENLRSLIHDGASELEISNYAFKNRQSLLGSGAERVLSGETSAQEVLRVCKSNIADEI